MKKALLLLLLIPLSACSFTLAQHPYVLPYGSCGYVVMLGSYNGSDIRLSKCMPLDQARDLTHKIDEDMEGSWEIRDQEGKIPQ